MFHLSIVTPEKVYCEVDINSLVVPGTEGYLGILSNHAPLISSLKPGKIEYKDSENKEIVLAVSGGFIEVSDNKATILADAVETTNEIDIERAKKARDRAKDRIEKKSSEADSDVNIDRARVALLRALNRLRVAGK